MWRWTAALEYGVEFGLFLPAWLGWVALLGKGHNDFSMSLLSVGYLKTCLFQSAKADLQMK